MRKITRIADAYANFAKWVAVISGIVVVLVMFYTTFDVVGRYFLNHPMPAAYELTNMSLVFITYFGVTLVQARGGHMRLGFLWEKGGPRGKALIDLVSVLFGLFIMVIVSWQGWIYAISPVSINDVTSGSYTVPLFPGRLALALGATIFVIQYILDLIKNILILINPKSIGSIPSTPDALKPDTNNREVGTV